MPAHPQDEWSRFKRVDNRPKLKDSGVGTRVMASLFMTLVGAVLGYFAGYLAWDAAYPLAADLDDFQRYVTVGIVGGAATLGAGTLLVWKRLTRPDER